MAINGENTFFFSVDGLYTSSYVIIQLKSHIRSSTRKHIFQHLCNENALEAYKVTTNWCIRIFL